MLITPNNLLTDLNALEDYYSSGVYLKRDLQIVRGEGATLFDDADRPYVDLSSGQGVANLGYGHPAILDALQQQSTLLMTCPEFLHTPQRARYQAALCQAADMARVFLCNSGAEAIEAALKFAVVVTGRTTIVSTMRGFHGRTLGALGTTWQKYYREPFADLIPQARFVPYNNLERMTEALDETVAAVIIEPIQGEGGVHPAEAGYLQAVQDLCRQHGALLILDEVQTGFGRTGHLFAYQGEQMQPDMVCLAKSIAGGLPMGAVLLHERVGTISPSLHGSTFGGNPLACAVAQAVLQTLQTTDLVAQTATRGEVIIAHLRQHLSPAMVREVRGRGFMIGLELRGKVAPILAELQARGVLALPAGPTVLRLLPPLVISDAALWQAIEIIIEVVGNAAE